MSAPAAAPSPTSGLSTRAIVRIVLTVIACVLALYLIYLLRRPLTWIFIAGFIAIALSGPSTSCSAGCAAGLAVALVYAALVLVPVLIMAALIPPIVTQGNNLAQSLPDYARDLTDLRAEERPAAPARAGLRHHGQARGAGRRSCPRGSATRRAC